MRQSHDCPIPGSIGCVPAVGPKDAKILLVGEAAGKDEAFRDVPFVGRSGQKLERMLGQVGMQKAQFRIANTVGCRPPRDWLVGAPWEKKAIEHCAPQLDAVLDEGHPVVVTLGGTALCRVAGFERGRGKEPVELNHFHGAPFRDPLDRFWIVPTYHPAFVMREPRFTKTFCWDMQVAKELAEGKWVADEPELIIDPPLEWFEEWIDYYLAHSQELWLAVDIETPYKGKQGEDELEEDPSWEITRINLSYSRDQGVTVPWIGKYRELAGRAVSAKGIHGFWNILYDSPRLVKDGFLPGSPSYDFMDAFRVLHSALPRSLGFVAPFYSRRGPWKHLGNSSTVYCALDGVQTLRCAFGIAADLHATGLWEVFERRYWKLDTYVLRPGEKVGIHLDRGGLKNFIGELREQVGDPEEPTSGSITREIQGLVPKELWPVSQAYTKPLIGDDCFEKRVAAEVRVCSLCHQMVPSISHNCTPKKESKPKVEVVERIVPRWFRRLPYNPRSRSQLLEVVKFKKHKPGVDRKTKGDTVDKKTLNRLIRTGDVFYPLMKKHRELSKLKGTYGDPLLELLDENDRIHPTFKHGTWTHRLSSVSPNWQNVVHHEDDENASGYPTMFRRAVQAAPGAVLITSDFSGIEAVQTGWCSGDRDYIRLAKLGVHAYLCSHVVKEPASLEWDDEKLGAYLKKIKRAHPVDYKRCKKTVHAGNYLQTPWGMIDTNPEIFPTLKIAKEMQALYFSLCPKLKQWHDLMVELADKQKFLGGVGEYPYGHPYGYLAEFFDVISWRKNSKGEWRPTVNEEVRKPVASFFPQSIAAGNITEALLRLFLPEEENWIGDAFFGETPFRAQIHDEIVLEVQEDRAEEVLWKLMYEMKRPIKEQPMPPEWGMGSYLQIGVEAKMGKNWAPFSEKNPDGMKVVGEESLAGDWDYEEEEE